MNNILCVGRKKFCGKKGVLVVMSGVYCDEFRPSSYYVMFLHVFSPFNSIIINTFTCLTGDHSMFVKIINEMYNLVGREVFK